MIDDGTCITSLKWGYCRLIATDQLIGQELGGGRKQPIAEEDEWCHVRDILSCSSRRQLISVDLTKPEHLLLHQPTVNISLNIFLDVYYLMQSRVNFLQMLYWSLDSDELVLVDRKSVV